MGSLKLRLLKRRIGLIIISGFALLSSTVAFPMYAQAARALCGNNWPHSRTNVGSTTGAYTRFKICWDDHYNARIDYNYSYVQDTKSDRKAARVWLVMDRWYPSTGWTTVVAGPIGTAAHKGTVVHYDYGESATKGWAIKVCNGPTPPYESGSRCSGYL